MIHAVISIYGNKKKVSETLDEYLDFDKEKHIWSHTDKKNQKDVQIIIIDSAKDTWRDITKLEIVYNESKYTFDKKMNLETLDNLFSLNLP